VILPDNDAAGKHYAKDVTEILNNLTPPCVVKILDLQDLPDGGDIADWVEQHLDNTVDVDTLGTEIEKLADTRKEVVMPANNMFEISEKSETSIGDKTQGGGVRETNSALCLPPNWVIVRTLIGFGAVTLPLER
jgi:selenophosphate synthetase-related protein